MSDLAPWSREWIEARAAELSSKPPAPASGATTSGAPSAYERAAAVLAWFDPKTLRPDASSTGDRSDDGSALLERLVRDCVPIEGDGDADGAVSECSYLSLRNDVRVRVLEQMATRAALRSALAANSERPRDVLQAIFEEHVQGKPRQLGKLSLEELSATMQVIDWLRATELGRSLPHENQVRQRLRYQELLQPFRSLAGTHFRGRKAQLEVLQEYVGVLEPTGIKDRVTRAVRTVLGRHRRAPLLVWGPGGIGKSTLIAKFILDHAAAGPAALPFVYLDCDRPGLVAEEPLTMLIESVRQIAVQFPEQADRCRLLEESWQTFIAADLAQGPEASATNRDRGTFIADFAHLVTDVGIRDTPYLLVVDTFEAVQYRSQDLVAELWRFLSEVREVLPRLRVVVAGRARPSGFPFEELYLDRLDTESAQAFLQARAKLPDKAARDIAERLRGNPLSLKLAAQVLRDQGVTAGATEILALDVGSGLGKKVDDNLIQGQLYHRILRHIRDREPMVSKLAHPGLVLRRVTPELILKVLAKPCGVKIDSMADAEQLFARFKRQVSLITQAGTREVRHRPDVRRAMLPLIRKESEAKSREIDEAAVAFYAQEEGPANRAEEIYHRLALGQSQTEIDPRFIDGVEDYLQGEAIDEIPARLRPYLASRVGIDLVELNWETVDTGTWERHVERRAQHLLQVDQPDQALALIRRRGDTDPQGRLPIWEAQALERMGRLREAATVARPVIARLESDHSDESALLDLHLLVARAEELLGDKSPTRQRKATLRRLKKAFAGDLRLAELRALYGEDWAQTIVNEAASGAEMDLNETPDVPAELLNEEEELAAGSAPAPPPPAPMRAPAAAPAAAKQPASAAAAPMAAPKTGIEVFGRTIGMGGSSGSATSAPQSAPRGLGGVGVAYHGTASERATVTGAAHAILRSVTDVAAFAKRFLGVPLESITPASKALTAVIDDVIEWAAYQGRMPEVVTGLREQAPGHPGLASFQARDPAGRGPAPAGQAPLGRAKLVEWMTTLERSSGGDVLIVDGPRGSGKSFTAVLLANQARASGAFDCVAVGLSRFARATSRDLVQEMARLGDWGLRSIPTRGEDLLLWLATRASRGRPSVLLFDECRAVEKTPVGDFVVELANLVLKRRPRGLSLVLVDFSAQGLPQARYEHLEPVGLAELHQLIRAQLEAVMFAAPAAVEAAERAARAILTDPFLLGDKARLVEAVEQLRMVVQART